MINATVIGIGAVENIGISAFKTRCARLTIKEDLGSSDPIVMLLNEQGTHDEYRAIKSLLENGGAKITITLERDYEPINFRGYIYYLTSWKQEQDEAG